MSFAEPDDLPFSVTVAEVLAYDEIQLRQHVQDHARHKGGCTFVGVDSLTQSQKAELGRRLNATTEQLRLESESEILNADDLVARLTTVAAELDRSPDRVRSRPLLPSFQPRPRTPLPDPDDSAEPSYYHDLIKDGGRPACSFQEWLHILAEPMARYKAILSWLTDFPDSEIGKGDLETVFARQSTRWWDFRKSQLENRGIGDNEEGISTFVEAQRCLYEERRYHAVVSAPSFEEEMRRMWQLMPGTPQLPHGQAFPAYREVVKSRLAPYRFTRPLQLKKNPRQQTKWTEWLEYLSYEQWWLETLTALVEPLEEQYHQALKRLLESNSTKAATSSAIPGFVQHRSANNVDPAKEMDGTQTALEATQAALEATRAALDATKKATEDFIRDTARYRSVHKAVYYHRHRVEWAVKEARLIETEMSQQRKTAKSDTKVDTNENEKRRRGSDDEEAEEEEEEEMSTEPGPKRSRRGDSGKSAASGTTPGKPQVRRSLRLANLQARLQTGV